MKPDAITLVEWLCICRSVARVSARTSKNGSAAFDHEPSLLWRPSDQKGQHDAYITQLGPTCIDA